jgi:hypothetical protein
VRLAGSSLATAGAPGTRFVIELPAITAEPGNGAPAAPVPAADSDGEAQTSTTTGRTIGRRRSRS